MNKENLKVEFKTACISFNITNYRYCFWRIAPSELNLFQRLFLNPWRQVWYIDLGTKETWISPGVFTTIKSKYKTVGDMIERENRLKGMLDEQRHGSVEAWKDALKKDEK